MGKAALIVTDMLNDFLDPQGSLYVGPQAREIIPFVAQKIAAFRAPGPGDHPLCGAANRGLPGPRRGGDLHL